MSRTLQVAAVMASVIGLGSFASAQTSGPPDVKLMPIGNAWARNSVNVTIFRQDSITTSGDTQYAAYYNADGKVVIARRTIGQDDWTQTVTGLTGNIRDAHNGISIIADGEGYLHISWDHHGNALHYARSKTPGSLDFETLPMSGQTESNVSYPQFFKLPDGNLIFMFRDGASGRGNLALNRYDAKTKIWTQAFANLISGEGQRNAYWQACVDPKGVIHVSWVWRSAWTVETNHNLCYAKSEDGGKTWSNSAGKEYALPIVAKTGEIVAEIPEKSELINQTSMCTDNDGRPVIATYFRKAPSPNVQYYIVRFDGTKWQTIQATDRKTTFSLSGGGSKAIPISRPQVIAKSDNGKTGVWVIFRDVERGSKVTMAGCPDLTNPTWTTRDLTDFSVRFWEPSYDHVRWARDGVLDLYVQHAGQGDGEKLENIEPQKAYVLEWKPQ